ncbi:hypothetical protein MRX96_051073 [Rhipicephalus microplus]
MRRPEFQACQRIHKASSPTSRPHLAGAMPKSRRPARSPVTLRLASSFPAERPARQPCERHTTTPAQITIERTFVFSFQDGRSSETQQAAGARKERPRRVNRYAGTIFAAAPYFFQIAFTVRTGIH